MQNWIQKVQRFGDTIRYRFATLAILIGGAFILMAAIGFAMAGGYMWLATLLPSYLAALSVAGVLFLLGALVIIMAARRSENKEPRSSASIPGNRAEADLASAHFASVALNMTMNSPVKAIATATVVGFIVGLLRTER